MADKYTKLDKDTLEISRERVHTESKENLLAQKEALSAELEIVNTKLDTLK